jgi:hypothetical protein
MSQYPEYNARARISILIAAVFLVLFGLALAIPGFGQALWQTIYCSFANVTCVSIVP